METKYIHLRNTSDANPYEPHHFGGRTVAFHTNSTNNTIEYGYTVVSMKDRYVKSTGRTLAANRLATKPAVVTMEDIKNIYPIEISPKAWEKLTIDDFNWRVLIAAVQRHMIATEQEEAFRKAIEQVQKDECRDEPAQAVA
jgi:hypothetical protein